LRGGKAHNNYFVENPYLTWSKISFKITERDRKNVEISSYKIKARLTISMFEPGKRQLP
jgi:hypothetical protein